MFRTLYARLALVLLLLFLAVGLLYALISTSATRQYLVRLDQQLNRDLARNLVSDRNLVAEGRIDEAALKETFRQYMVINPSIEIYLLDRGGRILSYSADPGKVKRRFVSLAPIRAFLEESGDYPLLGDDPRSHDRQKAFSVTPVPSAEDPEGYLYVVLRGQEFEAVERLVRESHLLRLSGWSVAASLGFGLLAGLVLFRLLTRRLHHLSRLMEAFQQSGFRQHLRYAGEPLPEGDEIDRLGTAFDRMAGRIRQQIEQLQQQDQLRRRLVAGVSHDLRTPLASLQGYLETLALKEEDLGAEERREYLAIALRQGRRLSRQLDELFQLASLDARETRPECEPFPLAELVQDVVQKYQLRAREQSVELRLAPPPELPFVLADISLTERVLENLLENALAHTPEGGTIDLALERDGSWIRVGVRDSGCGVPEADLARIFDAFYQGEGSGRDRRHAGLGLSIARRIIELQGGRIEAVSPPGSGLDVRFTLPLAADVTET